MGQFFWIFCVDRNLLIPIQLDWSSLSWSLNWFFKSNQVFDSWKLSWFLRLISCFLSLVLLEYNLNSSKHPKLVSIKFFHTPQCPFSLLDPRRSWTLLIACLLKHNVCKAYIARLQIVAPSHFSSPAIFYHPKQRSTKIPASKFMNNFNIYLFFCEKCRHFTDTLWYWI